MQDVVATAGSDVRFSIRLVVKTTRAYLAFAIPARQAMPKRCVIARQRPPGKP